MMEHLPSNNGPDDEPDLEHYAEIADVLVEQAHLCWEGLLHSVFSYQMTFEEAHRLMLEAYPDYAIPTIFGVPHD